MAVSIKITITQNSQDITNNKSNVTVKVIASWTYGSWNHTSPSGWVKINGTKYTFKSSFNTNKTTSGSTTLVTKKVNITHNDDGTKMLSCSASFATGVSSGTVTASKSLKLTTIPRKSTLTVGNGTLGTAQTLTVTRQSSSFTHTITYSCGSATGTICTKSTSTSISFTPPLSLASQNTTGTSVSITYTITTYNGSTSVGSNTHTKTCSIPASVKPSCELTVSDPTGYTSTYGAYVKGLSKIKVVVTPTTSYGSAIASYKTTANGSTYNVSSFTTGVVASTGTLNISATVTDKRGRTSNAATTSITSLAYSKPNVTKLTVGRCDADGTANQQGEYVKVTFNASITSLNNKNGATYTIQYKKTSDSSYNSAITLSDYTGKYSVSNGTYIFAAESDASYNVKINAKDNFSTQSRTTNVSTAFTLFHFSAGGTGIAIGKIVEQENLLDIGIPIMFREGMATKILWSGAWYMNASQTASLSEPVSKQLTGILLVFSAYADGEAQNYAWNSAFVSKRHTSNHNGSGVSVIMSGGSFGNMANKYVYVYDDKITGNDNNAKSGTANGITYDNTKYVLRYVIGV